MLKEKGQRLNALEQLFIVRALTQGIKDDEAISAVTSDVSSADTIAIVARLNVPATARYVYSINDYDYYVGECDGSETALYICKC